MLAPKFLETHSLLEIKSSQSVFRPALRTSRTDGVVLEAGIREECPLRQRSLDLRHEEVVLLGGTHGQDDVTPGQEGAPKAKRSKAVDKSCHLNKLLEHTF